jgi:F-type H+-transporting ATPase subunit gamma
VANLRDIQRRINSVVSTQQITRTMEMVATAKIKRATDRIVAATPYSSAMAEVLRSVARRTRKPNNPLLLLHESVKRIIVIVITSDRGMAGGFNSTVLRTTDNFVADMTSRGIECEIVTCGSKASAYFRTRNIPVTMTMRASSADPTIVDASRIASFVVDGYTREKCDQVLMFYNHARNVADQELRLEQVLPITQLDREFELGGEWESLLHDEVTQSSGSQKPLVNDGIHSTRSWSSGGAEDLGITPSVAARVAVGDVRDRMESALGQSRLAGDETIYQNYEFVPSATAVLNILLPDYVKTRIYHALLDSAAGEQGARRKAMKSATDNATEMINTLMRLYNRARQGAITTEITEIVGGAAALEDA